MFVKNFLTSGDFLTVVPAGYPMTIQYDVKGTIERVYKGWGESRVLLDKEVLHKIMQTNLVPRNIALKNGSTLVAGVLYTNSKFIGQGKLPDCIMDSVLDAYMNGSGTFNFFAGAVESHSTVFRGSAPVRQWLAFAGFNVLPGYVIPHGLTESGFDKLLHTNNFPFTHPLISDYIVFHNGQPEFHNVGLTLNIVDSMSTTTTPLGYVVSDVKFKDGSSTSWNYSDVDRLKLTNRSVVVRHEEGKPIYSYNNSDYKEDKLVCSFCGKLIKVPSSGRVRCDDPHCNSRLYFDTRKFLESLSVHPALTYERYIEISTQIGPQYRVIDVLDADEYKDIVAEVTIARLLDALIPVDQNVSLDSVTLFCNKCNNKVSTVEYYLENTTRVNTDLNLSGDPGVNKMLSWIDSDVSNLSDIITAFHHDQISLVNTDKKFSGAPIFRNRTLYVTGDFNHGSRSDVSAILASYSATVTAELTDAVDCVIVGDRHENINGSAIKHAQKLNIPIFTETEFFTKYQIDEDMAANL